MSYYDMDNLKYRPVEFGGKLYVPQWCYEDTKSLKGPIVRQTSEYVVIGVDYNKYRNMRRRSYYACNWYPKLVAAGIPTIDSKLGLFGDLKDLLSGPGSSFVRGCCASPKDVCDPIFDNFQDAHNALVLSERTGSEMCHVFVREIVQIEVECRCFMHKRNLNAISLYVYLDEEEKEIYVNKILDFFEVYGDKLPYNSAVVELATIDGSDFPLVVEFNSFGIDQFAGASRFDWEVDKEILYGKMERPVVRMPNEFDWT